MKGILRCIAFLLLASSAQAVDYFDARVTGIGVVAGEDKIRFTIDKDPNVVFTTDQYTGEQLKRLVAVVTAAYVAQSPVYLIRSSESSSSTTRHYTHVTIFSVGAYQFD